MKVFDVAFKDIRQNFRSLIGPMFMFVIPVLVTGLFYFMLGGANSEDENFSLPRTDLLLVNLDQGELPASTDFDVAFPFSGDSGISPVNSMGELLLQILGQDTFSDLLNLSEVRDPAAARKAVDDQEADVALIIPTNFTDALMMTDETAVIELYNDPTLVLGPSIVESLVKQFADSFVSTKIGTSVVVEQLVDSGVQVDEELINGVVAQFMTAALQAPQDNELLIEVQSPPGAPEEKSFIAEILSQILGGMTIFFAFFTGSAFLQSILTEEEKGTLARLFTTPTSVRTIIGGKVTSALIMLTVQVSTLLLFGRFVFKIDWGDLLPVVLAVLGIVLVSTATGVLIVSLVRNTRQAGAVYGGGLTLTGMVGLITIFTGGAASTPPAVRTVSLFVPQGWAVRGLQTAIDGGTVADILPTLAGLLVWIVVFVFIGLTRLRRRFA